MELETLIDEFYSGKTTKFEGTIKIKDIDTIVISQLNMTQAQQLVMVNTLSINKTNVAMNCTYVVHVAEDDKNKVIGDFETLVAYMFFGVDKVAKAIIPNEVAKA